MTDWQGVPSDITEYVGFVYIITNKTNGRYYIGQKKFWSKRTLKPLKGKTRKRKVTKESDWKDYYGSCKELKDDIKKLGKDKFERKILTLCHTKAEMNYIETREQFGQRVLFDDISYNRIINCRITSGQLNKYKEKLRR